MINSLNTQARAVSFDEDPPSGPSVATARDQTVGLKIRMHRRAAGMTLREIGDAVGVSFVQFHRYEKGTSQLSTVRLLAISKVLGVHVGRLLSEPVLTAAEHQTNVRRQESRELARLFGTLAEPESRQAVLLFVRAAVAREELFQAHADLASSRAAQDVTLPSQEIEE